MKETKLVRHYLRIAVIFVVLACSSACEKTKYDLLDPASAGVWTLYNTHNGLPGDTIRDIKLDNFNNLWVTFRGNGAATYSNGVWTSYKTTNSDILSNSVTSMGTKPDGSIIIGTANGITMRSASGQWSSYKDPLAATMSINTIKVASNGWVWVGTQNQGFYVDDGTGTGFQNLKLPGFENVYTIEEGKYHQSTQFKEIWLGTDNGLLRFDYDSIILKYSTSNGLPDNDVTSLLFDSKKRLWVGTFGGQTVSWIDDSGLNQLSLMNGNSGTFVRDIFEDRKGNIWFATWWDGLIQFDGVIPHSFKLYNGFVENDVNCIGEDKDGNLWFGLYSKGLVKYSLPLE
jgi:ligand-binding sensor domain-containing protein